MVPCNTTRSLGNQRERVEGSIRLWWAVPVFSSYDSAATAQTLKSEACTTEAGFHRLPCCPNGFQPYTVIGQLDWSTHRPSPMSRVGSASGCQPPANPNTSAHAVCIHTPGTPADQLTNVRPADNGNCQRFVALVDSLHVFWWRQCAHQLVQHLPYRDTDASMKFLHI